jgi:group I intron endonuclease
MGEIAEMSGYIYQISCLNTKRKYIGSSSDFAARKRGHLYLLRKGRHHSIHLQRAYAKYGERSFVFSVIEHNIPLHSLISKEATYIQQFHPEFNSDMPHPTRRGAIQSAACKAKVSAANKGRKRSPQTRLKIKAALLGNTYSAGKLNALKVTPDILKRIQDLRQQGFGCRRIASALGLNKTTILNVFNAKHSYGELACPEK